MRIRRVLPILIALIAVAAVSLVPPAAAKKGGGGNGKLLATFLTGDQEVPGPGSDTGIGFAALSLDQGHHTICVVLQVSGTDTPIAAHIHGGEAGVAGPIVVHLTPALETGFACIDDVDRSLVKDIRKHPEQYYVNVHTASFPAGAIRGQLG